MTPLEQAVEALREGIAEIDAASKACPVRATGSSPEVCPKCRSTADQSCIPEGVKIYALEDLVRNFLAAEAALEEGREKGDGWDYEAQFIDDHPLRYSPTAMTIERILFRRSLDNRLSGYTLETSVEIAAALQPPRDGSEQPVEDKS